MAYDPTSPPPMMSAIASDVRPSPGQVAKAVEVHCDEVVPLEASVIDEFGEVRAKSASASPTKSAFSNNPRFHNDRIVEKLTESRNLRPVGFPKHHIRNNKSVTFDAAPPQINEYEQATPDPSVGTVSREGSYDTISGSEGQDDSYLHGASADQDTTFDNVDEDGMTIPVIEPESWRSMTPEKAKPTRRDLVPDPFDSNEIDHTRLTPSMLSPRESSQTTSRSGSTASNESRRPLPPLPPSLADSVSPSSSSNTLMGGQATKDSPASPFATGVTKDDIKSSPRMSLAERLKLMGWQDQQDSASNAQEDQRERRMRRAMHKEPAQETSTKPESADKALPPTTAAAPSTGFFNLANYRMPKINRESILAKVRGLGGAADANDDDSSETGSSPIRGNEGFALNPDEPVPSIEHDPILEEDEEEYEVSGFDADDISELYNNEAPVAGDREVSPMSAVSSKDDGSVYTDTAEAVEAQMKQRSETSGSLTPKMAATTVDDVFGASKLEPHPDQSIMSLPDFGFESVLDQHDFGFDMKSYLTPSPPSTPVKEQAAHPPRDFRAPSMTSQLSELPAPRMPGYAEGMSEPQTPESVIRRSFVDSSRSPESPAVEEPVATVKASGGGKLKIRPSLTPADAEAMATARRQVSGQMPPPPMPAIPARHNGHRYSAMDLNAEKLSTPAHRDIGGAAATGSSEPIDSGNPGLCTLERKLTQKQKLVLQQLDLPLSSLSEELSMSLEADFDRVIENQKVQFDLAIAELSQRYANMAGLGISQGDDHPFGDHGQASRTDASAAIDAAKQIVANTYRPVQRGYLMRQNTKVVHASSNEEPALPTVEMPASRATKSAGNSPVKRPRESMTKAWQAEPWNGKARRQSIKHATRPTAPTKMDGPVPPLPGQESAVQAEADTSVPSILEQDSGEKGRLFVKVMGVKDLDLPLARGEPQQEEYVAREYHADEGIVGERTYFCLTLDNGLHCVTTSWLELGKNCPIGQEFELVVLQDLEFQLTLQAKLDAPKPPPPSLQPTTPSSRSGSPTKNKPSTFSRMFGSPKKREKKYEDEQRAADARQAQLDAKQRAMMNQTPQTSYELLQGLVARDGSFGRSYVSLKEYENKCYGRPIVVDVACFNEWGTEQVFSSSIKSKASTTNGLTGVQSRRRAPYKIGKLEVQLLFVPKPKAKTPARDGEKVAEVEMPKSLNAAVREMREFEERSAREFEGFLSQQGGDCPVSSDALMLPSS